MLGRHATQKACSRLLNWLWIVVWVAGGLPSGGCVTRDSASESLFVYCAAGMRLPMEEIAADYRRQSGVRVELLYGGSNTLLSQLQISGVGDLYLAADASYIETAQSKGLAGEAFDVATIRPVIVTRADRELDVNDLEDLTREDLRVALGSPEAAAIGLVTKQALESAGLWNDIERCVRDSGAFIATVNQVASDVELGSVDVGIVWDAVAAEFDGLRVTRSERLEPFAATIQIALLESSAKPEVSRAFAEYVTAPEHGRKAFAKHGFDTSSLGASSDTASQPSSDLDKTTTQAEKNL